MMLRDDLSLPLKVSADSAEHVLIRKLDSIFDLDEEDRQALLDLPVTLRDVAAGQDIVTEGDEPSQCCIVLEGLTNWYKMIPDGRRQIVAFHLPGDIPDLQSLYLGVLDCSLAANTPCRLATVRHEDLKAICRARPRIAAALWRSSLIDGAIFREWILGMGRRSARENAAHLLCEMLVRLDAAGLAVDHQFALPLTQIEMADALGLTPVSVNRALQDLRAERLVAISRRSVRILDWAGLKRVCHFDPAYLHCRSALANAD